MVAGRLYTGSTRGGSVSGREGEFPMCPCVDKGELAFSEEKNRSLLHKAYGRLT